MQCTTIKAGQECSFAGKAGCTFNGGNCYPVIEACGGCSRTLEANGNTFCLAVPDPRAKWRMGNCNLATHAKEETKAASAKINPLKASKRAARR